MANNNLAEVYSKLCDDVSVRFRAVDELLTNLQALEGPVRDAVQAEMAKRPDVFKISEGATQETDEEPRA